MKTIVDLINEIICTPEEADNIIEHLSDDPDGFRKQYTGFLEESVFLTLIRRSKKNKYLDRFLSALVTCVLKEEVSNLVFTELIHHRSRYHDTILNCLAHLPLSYYQLITLNQYHQDEALCQLLVLFLEHECFTEFDAYEILRPWKGRITPFILESIHYCLFSYSCPKKERILEKVEVFSNVLEKRFR